MNRVEDRISEVYKAQEREFYSDQWVYNTRIEEQERIINNPECSVEEKAAATREIVELENERKDSIDFWKEKHGAYYEEMMKWTIDEAVMHGKDEDGLDSMEARYDKNQYGHVEEHEQEEEQDEELSC